MIKQIEAILYSYSEIPKEIKFLELELEDLEDDYNGFVGISYGNESSKTNRVSDQVASEVMNIEFKRDKIQRDIRKLDRKRKKIELAVDFLNEEEKVLVKLRYFKKQKWINIELQMNMALNHLCNVSRPKMCTKLAPFLLRNN